jgi:hypothetical protein
MTPMIVRESRQAGVVGSQTLRSVIPKMVHHNISIETAAFIAVARDRGLVFRPSTSAESSNLFIRME